MIKYFERGDKEQLKNVLEYVYGCQNVEKMKDKELVFCYIAKTLKSLEKFCEVAEEVETDLGYRVEKLEKRLKKLEKKAKK